MLLVIRKHAPSPAPKVSVIKDTTALQRLKFLSSERTASVYSTPNNFILENEERNMVFSVWTEYMFGQEQKNEGNDHQNECTLS